MSTKGEWIKKMWCVMGYYSAIKRREGVLPFGTIWIDLEDIAGAYPVAEWLSG